MVSCLVHARKRPSGPLTRRYAPTAAIALPGPLRPRTEASETFLARIALQGRGGRGRTCQHSSRLRRATAPFTRSTPFNYSWRLYAADAAFRSSLLL